MSSSRVVRALDWWSSHRWVDLAAGAASAVAYLGWREWSDRPWAILDASARGTLYATLAATAAALLAFGMTPIAIVLALTPGPRLRALMETQSEVVRRTLMWVLWGLLGLLATALTALTIDTGAGDARWIRYVLMALAVQTLLATARLVRVFGLLLLNVGRDSATQDVALKRIDRRAG